MEIDKSKRLMQTSLLGHAILWTAFGVAFWRPDYSNYPMYTQLGLVTWVAAQIGLVMWSWKGRGNGIAIIGILDTLVAVAGGLVIGFEGISNAEWEFLWQLGSGTRIVWIGLLLLSGATLLRLRFAMSRHPSHGD